MCSENISPTHRSGGDQWHGGGGTRQSIDTADSYWDHLSGQREGARPVPNRSRLGGAGSTGGSRRDGFKQIHDPQVDFCPSAATFDPAFFGISPRGGGGDGPAAARSALRLAWRALENSGINPDDLAITAGVGCYIGASVLEYGPELSEYSKHRAIRN